MIKNKDLRRILSSFSNDIEILCEGRGARVWYVPPRDGHPAYISIDDEDYQFEDGIDGWVDLTPT